MLLVHQAGRVKVGEVIRYTLTYTPSNDRILPTPPHLHVKIRNTSAIPLRAAFLHGPYVLHVAAYPSTFNPHRKVEDAEKYGVPEYEPMLKAGGSWQTKLTVPEGIRETGADLGKRRVSVEQAGSDSDEGRSMTWIIEIHSQILFSNSASVNFEVLVGRDERSLELGFAAVAGHGHGAPGQIKERQQSAKERERARRSGNIQTAGVYSKAVRLVAEDTDTLWDKPALPRWEEERKADRNSTDKSRKKRRKVHLVVVTHGLHGNVGTDMLFLKESIDATVKQARIDTQKRKESYRVRQKEGKQSDSVVQQSTDGEEDVTKEDTATAPLTGGQEDLSGAEEGSDDEEETIVRGFTGNAVRTENGIQYLGKRLAMYILRFTYPDQPFRPVKKPLSRMLTDTFKSDADKARRDGLPSHQGSSVTHPKAPERNADELPYKFTSISFIGHSLGGLVQTYAIAYIHKHSPTFFQQIQPVNFICMASPMLGLSNENPLYVKFALDFGLVGRTGKDLGLTWRPNIIARGGWNAMIGGLGSGNKDGQEGKPTEDPAAKPLLRILPTGPAHQVLKMFRNRTVYSNVVNDGIVPLRTSCLLFLDWRGLGKVEKARRENGLIGTMAEWGWAELTGANASALPPNVLAQRFSSDEDDDNQHVLDGDGETVPLPAEDETAADNKRQTGKMSLEQTNSGSAGGPDSSSDASLSKKPTHLQQERGVFDILLDFFRPSTPDRSKTPPQKSKKTGKALQRGQTIHHGEAELPEEATGGQDGTASNPTMRPHMTHHPSGQAQSNSKRPMATRGDSVLNDPNGEVQAPPQTSIFESARDILHPPLPSRQWITDPSSRARTIFHDRVYHPEDIPPPPVKRQPWKLARSFSSDSSFKSNTSGQTTGSQESTDSGAMRVEERIARAYHRDLSWRKVLVRLEPDAHNNMIVRRMFANAYGWPVIKHLCDTHFADTYSARTRDEDEPARERAPPVDKPVPEAGEQVKDQTSKKVPERTRSETREARDELADLNVAKRGLEGGWSSEQTGRLTRESSTNSVAWDDSVFEGSDDDDSDVDERNIVQRMINPHPPKKPEPVHHRRKSSGGGSTGVPVTPTSSSFTDGHRGLTPRSPTAARTPTANKGGGSVGTPPTSPASQAGEVDAPKTPVVTDHLEEEPQTLKGSPTELGLRKSVAERISSPSGKS